MKQRAITAILLSMLIGFAVASWGRVREWWADLSAAWKTGVFMFGWALLILIGWRYGPTYALAGLITGVVALVLIMIFAIKGILNEWDK